MSDAETERREHDFVPSCLSSWPFRDPFRVFSNPLESLRGLIFYLLDRYFSSFLEIFSPFPTFGGSLLSLLQPLSGPSLFFVALRGYVFAFSPFVNIFFPLPDPWRTPIEPPPTPSWPFAVLRGPSWICFCLFALRGYLLPPSRPLANPYRASSNPLVALRRSSWPFVDMFLPFRPSWISFLVLPGQPHLRNCLKSASALYCKHLLFIACRGSTRRQVGVQ